MERHQSGIRQLTFAGVDQLDSDHVVLPGQSAECRLVAAGQEIRDDEKHRAPSEDRLEVLECRGQIGPGAGRLEGEELAEDAEDVPAPFAGGDYLLDAIGKEESADPIVVPRGRQREDGADLGGQLSLGPETAAESLRGAEVHHEADGELPLFQVALDIRGPQARRDVPVDTADIVSGLIFAHLGELDSPATKGAGVLSGHDVPHQMPGSDLDAPHLPHDLLGGHGTGTVSKILASSASGPMPSASAR